jgi:hypothetical protein
MAGQPILNLGTLPKADHETGHGVLHRGSSEGTSSPRHGRR